MNENDFEIVYRFSMIQDHIDHLEDGIEKLWDYAEKIASFHKEFIAEINNLNNRIKYIEESMSNMFRRLNNIENQLNG